MKKVRIYTKGGDRGKTSLFGGKRVSKDSIRIEAIGTVDELNASLGLIESVLKDKKTRPILTSIQNNLFDIGAEIANPRSIGKNTRKVFKLEQEKVNELEIIIDQVDSKLKPLSDFILPGGTEPSSRLHFARSVTRRAERRIIQLSRKEKINSNIISYLNRLSDLLFVLARNENKAAKLKDQLWRKD